MKHRYWNTAWVEITASFSLFPTLLRISDQDGRGRVEYDHTEQGLEFLRAALLKPPGGLWQTRRGVHNAFLLLPADPGSRLPAETRSGASFRD
jgi:hypothetical protein